MTPARLLRLVFSRCGVSSSSPGWAPDNIRFTLPCALSFSGETGVPCHNLDSFDFFYHFNIIVIKCL